MCSRLWLLFGLLFCSRLRLCVIAVPLRRMTARSAQRLTRYVDDINDPVCAHGSTLMDQTDEPNDSLTPSRLQRTSSMRCVDTKTDGAEALR